MNLQKKFCTTVLIVTASWLLAGTGTAAIVEDFEGHTATGETTLLPGWTLIDGDGFNGPENYESEIGSDGAGGNSGFAGSLNIGTYQAVILNFPGLTSYTITVSISLSQFSVASTSGSTLVEARRLATLFCMSETSVPAMLLPTAHCR